MQAELAAQARQSFARDAAAGELELEGALASEVSRQQCPVCFDLMAPPERTPMMLFPCGHTFCAMCINAHMKAHRKDTCPCCRESIQGQAVNRALVAIVERLLSERPEVAQAVAEGVPGEGVDTRARAALGLGAGTAAGDAAASGRGAIVDAVESAELRLRILTGELEKARSEASRAAADAEAVAAAATAMDGLVAEARRKVEDAQAELALAESHAAAATERRADAQARAGEASARAALVEGTIAGLIAELDKNRLLLRGV